MRHVLLVGASTGVEVFESDDEKSLFSTANSRLNDKSAPNGVLIATRTGDDYVIGFKWPGVLGYHLNLQDLP